MTDKLFYIQDTRDYVGNSMLWWARDHKGYTCDIRKAHIFSESEIEEMVANRETDKPWPKDFIDNRIAWHVDSQSCNNHQLEQWKKDNGEQEEKPLFIALKSEYFKQFKSGHKHAEYRLYGKRWNENTCRIGRKVTLSNGYGKKDRITREIVGFYKRDVHTFGSTAKQAILDCYGTLDKPIAEIRMY